MAAGPHITALAGYDLQWWHFALAGVAAVVVVVGGFFAGRRLLPVVRGWTRLQQAGAAAAVVLVLAGIAYAVYTAVDRPGDVLNEDVDFERSEQPRKKIVQAVNWPVYGYDDERTRYFPSTRVNPPFHSSEWSFQAGKLLEFSPIVVKKRLFFVDKDALVYSMDGRTGKVIWKRKVGGLSAASPAYEDGRLFVVTLEPGDVQAMRPRSGEVLWERDLGARSETSPVVFGDTVIVGNESGTVFALNVKTGKAEWTVDSAGEVKGGVAIADGVVYFGNYAGEVFAVDAHNGEVKWQTGTTGGSFGRTGRVYSTPAVAYGRVYVGSIDSRVYSFDADTGELAWSQSTGAEVYPGPAVAEVPGGPPTVYIGSADKDFYALDARTGRIRWQHDTGGIIIGAASVIGDVAYVGVIGPKNGTIGFDADNGKRVFEHELGEYNPAISDGKRLYLTGESSIRAFLPDLHPGREKKKGDEKGEGDRKQGDEKPSGGDGGEKRDGGEKPSGGRKQQGGEKQGES
jgi:outer membrane protein assembly factor BamB